MAKKKVSNKGMNKNLVIGIVVVVLLLIGVFWYFNNQKEVGLSPPMPPMGGPGNGDGDGTGTDEESKGKKQKATCLSMPFGGHPTNIEMNPNAKPCAVYRPFIGDVQYAYCNEVQDKSTFLGPFFVCRCVTDSGGRLPKAFWDETDCSEKKDGSKECYYQNKKGEGCGGTGADITPN